MTNASLEEALVEIDHVKKECLDLVQQLDHFCNRDSGEEYPHTFRLIAIPMLYSAWERCFTLCNSIAFRLIRDKTSNAYKLAPPTRAAWLQASPFFGSFSAKLQSVHENDLSIRDNYKSYKPGKFKALIEFIEKFDTWSSKPLDAAINTEDLVMTFSNVNPKVVEINAMAVGIFEFQPFQKLKFGRLHDLVGRRNDIGHGAIISPPSNEEFCSLWEFTVDTITKYCEVYSAWLASKY